MARLSSIPAHLADAFERARAEGRLTEAGVNADALGGVAAVRGPAPPPPPEGCSEAVFQAHVRAVALWGGWKFFHPFDSRRSDPDFPDCVACRAGAQGVAAELKVKNRKATPGQLEWLDLLRMVGFRTYVWRPKHWATIVEVLT